MKNSIYTKIKNRTLFMAAAAVAVVTLIMAVGLFNVRRNVLTTGDTLGNAAAADSKSALIEQTTDALVHLIESKALLSDEKLRATEIYVEQMSYAATMAGSPEGQFDAGRLRDLLLNNIAVNADNELIAYYGTEQGEFIFSDRYGNEPLIFDPRGRPWYTEAKAKNALIWTDVYDDREGRGLSITCAKPYYDSDGRLAGVAGVGMLLTELSKIVTETEIEESGHAFMMNESGHIIIGEDINRDADKDIIMKNLLGSPGQAADTTARAAALITRGESGIKRISDGGIDKFIVFHGLEVVPWVLAAVADVDEIIEPAVKSEGNIIALKQSALSEIDKIVVFTTAAAAAALASVMLLVLIFSGKLAKGVTKPILELTKGAVLIGGGDLTRVLDIRTGDELETLSDTFNSMIANIRTITAEKERIGAELDVAAKIQASMLPGRFPAFPERTEFDIYAAMQPAKEVGGDFYDFFLVDSNTLAVVIADVSGKGVPAALFMVIAKTLVKSSAQIGKNPAEVFETVNNLLYENNDEGMFVTAFMGYIDIPSGRLTYVNAGHNPPLIRKAGGAYEFLKVKPSLFLAGMEGVKYRENETALSPGDVLCLYTDGVTEAMNADSKLFSDDRLISAANLYAHGTIKELLAGIKREIDAFVNGAEQSDDITMLALSLTHKK